MNKCTLCDLEGCETLTKKMFHEEEKDLDGNTIIVHRITYSCCFDNKHKEYCYFCLNSPKVRDMILAQVEPLKEPKFRNINPYDRVYKK